MIGIAGAATVAAPLAAAGAAAGSLLEAAVGLEVDKHAGRHFAFVLWVVVRRSRVGEAGKRDGVDAEGSYPGGQARKELRVVDGAATRGVRRAADVPNDPRRAGSASAADFDRQQCKVGAYDRPRKEL